MTITRTILALLAITLSAEERNSKPAPSYTGTAKAIALGTSVRPAAFYIYDGYKEVLKIKLTGEVIFGEGITPTEAAKQFAEALRKMLPEKFACEEKK